jgi:CRISPR-associated exonuclease Cas4
MFGVTVPRGAIYHADSKRRRDVGFTGELRQRTEQAVASLYRLLAGQTIPPAEFKRACEECSLFDICQPRATESRGRIDRLARQLYQV